MRRPMKDALSSNDDAILTEEGAAEFLKVKPRTIDEWMRKRRIPFCNLPQRLGALPEEPAPSVCRQIPDRRLRGSEP